MALKPATTVRVRVNAHKLAPSNDVFVWYGKAVTAMKARSLDDPTGWRYQAAIHGINLSGPAPKGLPPKSDRDKFWDQCQHQSWFFLPWHRAYLACFEAIVADAVASLGGPKDWALPYWNYSDSADPNATLMPAAFVPATFADGTANPLFVRQRSRANGDFGFKQRPQLVSLESLVHGRFAGTTGGGEQGFGGPRTVFNHFGSTNGRLESVPHNAVHSQIGGLMGDPDTAALDPIFWLHHANIDRLWEVWRNRDPAFKDPTEKAWTTAISFPLHDQKKTVLTFNSAKVEDTTKLLHGYRYDDISDPIQTVASLRNRSMWVRMMTDKPAAPKAAKTPKADLVGATERSVTLSGPSTTALVVLQPKAVAARRAASSASLAARPPRAFLNLENVTGTAADGNYDVYIDLPEDNGVTQRLLAGVLSTFGVRAASALSGSHGGSGITTVIEITDIVDQLRATGRWDETKLHVSFSNEQQTPGEAAPISIGRVSVFYE